MKVVVYTAVFGGDVDRLRPAPWRNPDVEYRCYTDDPTLSVSGWEMRHVVATESSAMQARRIKILSHLTESKADATLWIDSAYQLLKDPYAWIAYGLLQQPVRALRHPHRQTAVEEGLELVRLGLAADRDVQEQLTMMAGEWRQEVLTSTGLLVRRNMELVKTFNRTWWSFVVSGGHPRDQMTVDYAAWCTGVPITYLEGQYRDNPYAHWQGHRR